VTTVVAKLTDIQASLDALARQHKVPGASLGVLAGDELLEFATGVTNLNTKVPVTPDTLFQIGSNTKVYTTTLVMQLVDDGKVDLDAPAKRYVPELKLTDAGAEEAITVRMLVTHLSGIEGDYFEDFGRGDDGLAKYVESFATLGQIYAPGEMWSYCNSGFCLAGLVVEKVTGEPYHKALRDRLLAPLRCDATTVLMEEMLAHSCAVGHVVPAPGKDPVVAPRVVMSPSHAPAGSMTTSTPREVLRFVRMHLDDGKAPDGRQLLSAKCVKAMQQPQAKLPRSALAEAMGLGWILSTWDGERVIGHGGGTIGQLSFLQVLPDRPLGVVLLTNSTTGALLWRDLARYLFEELAGVKPPSPPKPAAPGPKLDLRAYEGRFRRHGIETEIVRKKGSLVAKVTATGALADISPPQELVLEPIDAELFFVPAMRGLAQFVDFDANGRPQRLYVGSRVANRAAAKKAPTATKKR
jgi:CubicO group peptidase (beta-lactamase class C family)